MPHTSFVMPSLSSVSLMLFLVSNSARLMSRISKNNASLRWFMLSVPYPGGKRIPWSDWFGPRLTAALGLLELALTV